MTAETRAASRHSPAQEQGQVVCGAQREGPGPELWLHFAGPGGRDFRVCPAGPECRSCDLAWLTLILSLQSSPALQFQSCCQSYLFRRVIQRLVCSFIHSTAYSITYSSLYSFTITHSLIHIHFLKFPLTHLCKITLIHSFIHSPINFFI